MAHPLIGKLECCQKAYKTQVAHCCYCSTRRGGQNISLFYHMYNVPEKCSYVYLTGARFICTNCNISIIHDAVKYEFDEIE